MTASTYLLLFSGGDPGPPVEVPASLQAALRAFWLAAGLDGTIAPLRALGVAPGASLPCILIVRAIEDLPGETEDDTPVLLSFAALSTDGEAEARALANAAIRALVFEYGASRDQLSWEGGGEKFAELYDSGPQRWPGKARGNRPIYAQAFDLTFWISGRA